MVCKLDDLISKRFFVDKVITASTSSDVQNNHVDRITVYELFSMTNDRNQHSTSLRPTVFSLQYKKKPTVLT